MTKTLRCGDVMDGCKSVIEGKDANEVMTKASEHARKDHGINAIPPDAAKKAQAAIRDK